MEIRFENEVYDLELAFERKLLHDAIEEFTEDQEWADELEQELEEIHALISNKDVDKLVNCFFEYSDIAFTKVESDELLQDALLTAGYQVESSNVSRSLYAKNDNGEEVRISNHKRPAIENNGIWEEVEYDNEIIVSDNVVNLKVLHFYGFSKLNKSEYLLG